MSTNPQWRLLLIAYAFVVIGMVAGFARIEYLSTQLDQRTKERAIIVCELHNDTRADMAAILDGLAAPRPEDGPNEHAQRLAIRERLDSLVQPIECQPPIEIGETN